MMENFKLFALCLKLFVLVNIFKGVCLQDIDSPLNYVLVNPSRLIAGTSNRICVSRMGGAVIGQASAQLELTVHHNHPSRGNKYIARARRIFYEGSGGCFDILISKTYHKKATLHFRMRFSSLPDYRVNIRREVELYHDSNIIMIQTDKPLYRAGETVKFRVFQLKADFTPNQIPIHRVSIEAPADIFGGPVKNVQWFNISTQLGLVQREYTIDKYAQQGEWRIVADSRDPSVGSVTQSFQVTDYALPSFHLEANYDEYILITYKQLVWNICARYMHGDPVSGKLEVVVESDSYDSSKITFSTILNGTNPCYNYTLRTQHLGFGKEYKEPPKTVIANIGFQEEGTKSWKNISAISQVKKQVIYIEFVDPQVQYYKPGLPQQIKVKVTDWKKNDVMNAKVQFCKTLNNKTDDEIDNLRYSKYSQNLRMLMDECDTKMTDSKGFATFAFTVGDDLNVNVIRLKTLILDHPLHEFEVNLDDKRFPSAVLVLKTWESTSWMNMDIGPSMTGANGLKPGSKHTFPIFVTMSPEEITKPVILHYLLITRSGILLRWGVTVQCARPLHDAETMRTVSVSDEDLSKCPRVEHLDDSNVFKMMISVKILHTMCPYSYLVAYYQHSNGQLIVASKKLNVQECFFNKVNQQWIPNVVAPKESVSLHIKSPGPALCMLDVSNVALQHAMPVDFKNNRINEKLKHFIELKYNKAHSEDLGDICIEDNISSEDLKNHYTNILRAFQSSGLDIASDLIPQHRKCSTSEPDRQKPSSLIFSNQEMASKERNYFPETWLWDIHVMDSNGSLAIHTTAPDEITQWKSQVYCLSRSGIAINVPGESSVLKVFQPFYIDLRVPKIVKRGEETAMFYKIFNYMDYDIPVQIDLNITPNAAVTVVSHELKNNFGRTSCIPPKQSIVNYFSIKGHQLRSVNITVTAMIQKNLFHICHKNDGTTPHISDTWDRVTKEISIEPEGIPMEKHKSALLCINENSNKTEMSWNIERVKCVEESENWFIHMVGDITGPMALNVENLIQMPMGCGEQNMALLAYNLIALEYSITGKRVPTYMKENALKNLETGYQKQLRYRHPSSGAFSAFGPEDEQGSTWLTAFCVKYLYIMRTRWGVGAENGVIEKAAQWLLGKQMENGCFVKEGQVFHKEMKGGLRDDTSNIALTAYVILSVIDTDTSILHPSVIKNAAYCLAALKYNEHSDRFNRDKIYAFALATLAQIKIEMYNSNLHNHNEVTQNKLMMARTRRSFPKAVKDNEDNENGYLAGGGLNALVLLKSMAQTNGEMVWWETGSLTTSIETTGYAMLCLLQVGGEENVLMAMSAARWLSMHRNSKGGFYSTQDTLIAMEAIYTLRKSLPDMPPSMNVMVQGPSRGRHFTVNPQERYKLHTVMIKAVDKLDVKEAKLKIKVEGKGCLLVQATQQYNTLQAQKDYSSLRIFSKVFTDGIFSCKDGRCMCAAVLEVCLSWVNPSDVPFPEMALMEIVFPTGYAPDKTHLFGLIKHNNTLLRRIEESESGNSLYFYLSIKSKTSNIRPSECYKLYLVGPQTNTLPGAIVVKDYYHPENTVTSAYSIPESCPSDKSGNQTHEERENSSAESDEHISFQAMHVIDSDVDLDFPRSAEGVPPVYALPPVNFDRRVYGRSEEPASEPDIRPQGDSSLDQMFTNWTMIDSDIDLEFPEGLEGNKPVWQMPENASFSSQIFHIAEKSNYTDW